MTEPIWSPSPQRIAQSAMHDYLHQISKQHPPHIISYQDLHSWSIEHPEAFWSSIWDYCGVIARHKGPISKRSSADMLGTSWFPEGRLNFAENLLNRPRQKIAISAYNESGKEETITQAELVERVRQMQGALLAMGIQPHDVVAAILPHSIDTVIAALAVTSIGAIWSSCATDFGSSAIYERFSQISPTILFAYTETIYHQKHHSAIEKIRTLVERVRSIKQVVTEVPIRNLRTGVATHIFSALCAQNSSHRLIFTPFPFNHPLYIVFSSGTTGKPKCMVHSAGGTLLQHLKEHRLHTNIGPQDNLLYYTNCGWMMWNWQLTALATGASLTLYDGSPLTPSPTQLLSITEQANVTVLGASARYFAALENAGVRLVQPDRLKTLHTILSTGSPLYPSQYDYIYSAIKSDICLASISGGTDILSCFALGNPLLPVYRGELTCIGLGMDVAVVDNHDRRLIDSQGMLACMQPFPSMPLYFLNDPDNRLYKKAYFSHGVDSWHHGDYALYTSRNTVCISGRYDAVLNPGGVRIGTGEIYQQLALIYYIKEAVAVSQQWQGDSRIILLLVIKAGTYLTAKRKQEIRMCLRQSLSPHHVPAHIIRVKAIPLTKSGKIMEKLIRNILNGIIPSNLSSVSNPEALKEYYRVHRFLTKHQ